MHLNNRSCCIQDIFARGKAILNQKGATLFVVTTKARKKGGVWPLETTCTL